MIHERLANLKKTLPPQVKLIAVSKTKPATLIQEAYDAGQRVFGENKAQEMQQKHALLPHDIEWHFIGHLQTNKVKYIAPFVHLIHSVDSLKLLNEINREAQKNNRMIDCLLQFHIATEETKFGLDMEEVKQLLQSDEFQSFENIRICGVMGMATFTDNEETIRKEFRTLKHVFDLLKQTFFSGTPSFKEISMGMSSDFPIAIEEGATMIRVGSLIFGARNDSKH
ncbi:MAG: YggS family pyridoxal phosphate-dependent enzyme [Lentimicrobiaceae bacterium]|jgi:pyridoxal phosphate enzyme (YggS family)|nr:YggS family pyridoxal phosphate-dependent enzyme [Lentimicrobiaceae bacterium]